MTRKTQPRAGSGTHQALLALQALAGQATDVQWHEAAVKLFTRPAAHAQWEAFVVQLINMGMVFRRGPVFVLSDEGRLALGEEFDVVPRAEPEHVPARYVPPMRPLSTKHLVNVRMMREGAFDYRDIPSRHGDQRLPFATSLTVAGVAKA